MGAVYTELRNSWTYIERERLARPWQSSVHFEITLLLHRYQLIFGRFPVRTARLSSSLRRSCLASIECSVKARHRIVRLLGLVTMHWTCLETGSRGTDFTNDLWVMELPLESHLSIWERRGEGFAECSSLCVGVGAIRFCCFGTRLTI